MNEQTTTDGRVQVTPDEAIALLPEGDSVHTFMDGGFALIGANWSRREIVAAIRQAESVEVTGEMAQSARHGLAIRHPDEPLAWLFIETVRRTDIVEAPR